MNKLKLSICIPTYNRSECVINLLELLKKEVIGFENQIEIIVSSNSTEESHINKVADYSKENTFFTYSQNDKNIGGVPNQNKLAKMANGEFIWIFGDDDYLENGTIEYVMSILNNESLNLGLIFLSTRGLDGNFVDTKVRGKVIDGLVSDVEDLLLNYNQAKNLYADLLFTSVNVLRRTKLLEAVNSYDGYSSVQPLYCALYCLRYGMYVSNKPIVFQAFYGYGTETWSDRRVEVSCNMVYPFFSIPQKYSEELSKKMFFKYLKGNFVRYAIFFIKHRNRKESSFVRSKFTFCQKSVLFFYAVPGFFKYIILKLNLKINKNNNK